MTTIPTLEYSKLQQFIRERELTDCLNEIERLGVHRDFAIFLLNHVSAALGGEDE